MVTYRHNVMSVCLGFGVFLNLFIFAVLTKSAGELYADLNIPDHTDSLWSYSSNNASFRLEV